MSILGRNSEPSQEEMLAMQQEQERAREERNTANQLAQAAAREEGTAKPGYWGVLTNPDIGSDIEEYDQYIEDFLSSELSGQNTIGNISRQDWLSWNWRIEYEMWMVKNEFKDPDCGLDSVDMAAMGYEDKPVLTDTMARRLRSAEHARKMMLSNSIDARGQRSGTEIHAVARTEDGPGDEDEDGGGGWRGWLSR